MGEEKCAYLHESTPVVVRDSSGDPIFAGSASCEGALAVAEERSTVTYTGSTYTSRAPVQENQHKKKIRARETIKYNEARKEKKIKNKNDITDPRKQLKVKKVK